MPRRSDRFAHLGTGLLPLFVASFLFGTMALSVRVASREMSAMQIAFFRFVGSLVVMVVATGGRGLRPRAGNLGRLLFRGFIGASAISLYFVGIAGAGAGLASLLQSTYPVFAALLGSALLGERFTARLALALGLNLAGAVFVLGAELRVDPAATFGMLASIGAAVLSGGAIVTARHLRHSENAALITTYFMAVGALVTAPALFAGLPHPASGTMAAVAVVVLTSVAAQWLLHHGLGFVTAAQASLVAATGVVTAATLESLWFGESLHPATIVGGALMLTAVGLASSSPSSVATPGATSEGSLSSEA